MIIMKKTLCISLIIPVLAAYFSICAFAGNSGWYTSIKVDDEYVSLIKNEYFNKYADYLFEETYDIYISQITQYSECNKNYDPNDSLSSTDEFFAESIHKFFNTDSIGRIGYELYTEMKNSDEDYYVTVYLNYKDEFSADKNNSVLQNVSVIKEILYVGTTTPCATICIKGCDIDTLLTCTDIEFINYPMAVFNYQPSFYIPENGNRIFAPKAADARKILRYSAGLEDLSDMTYHSQIKEFYILSDTNLDGKINAADARTALRIAAGLENGRHYYVDTDSFW